MSRAAGCEGGRPYAATYPSERGSGHPLRHSAGNPTLLHTEALQKIIRSNRNRLEIEMHELVLDIMDSVGTDTFSFCYSDILLLLVHSQVKVEKHQVRKVLQECWKLTPAPNGLTYTTYQFNCNRECRYEPIRRVGRFYTVTREQLESL